MIYIWITYREFELTFIRKLTSTRKLILVCSKSQYFTISWCSSAFQRRILPYLLLPSLDISSFEHRPIFFQRLPISVATLPDFPLLPVAITFGRSSAINRKYPVRGGFGAFGSLTFFGFFLHPPSFW